MLFGRGSLNQINQIKIRNMPFMTFLGRQCDQFARGCYDGIIDGASQTAGDEQVPFSDQVPISASEMGKKAINEALRSGDPDRVVETIEKVCWQEKLSKVGCAKAVLKGSTTAIRGACTNLLA